MQKGITFFYLAMLELKRRMFGIAHTAAIDLTDECNLRCRHCYHFEGKEKFQKQELSLEIWRERFNGLYGKGIRFLFACGGEPALRQDVLMLANEIFPYIYVVTNGLIKITERFQHTMFVSMDGREETNDFIRGKGVTAKVIENYSGDKRVIICMTASMLNYRELQDVILVAKGNGLRGVVCNLYTPLVGQSHEMFITPDQRKIIIEELRRVKALYPNDFLNTEKMLKWYESADHRGHCYWGDEVLHYDAEWRSRKCFGNKADCSNCGVLAGATQDPIMRAFDNFLYK